MPFFIDNFIVHFNWPKKIFSKKICFLQTNNFTKKNEQNPNSPNSNAQE